MRQWFSGMVLATACALIGLAGSGLASAAPLPPTVDSTHYWLTSGTAVELTGSKQPDASLTVAVDGVQGCIVPSSLDTSWSCILDGATLGLGIGDYGVSVMQADATGSSPANTEAVLSVRRHPAPTVTAPPGVVSGAFTVAGTADPAGLAPAVDVFVAGEEFASPVCSASVAAGGVWSCTVPFDRLTGATTRLVAYEHSLLSELLDANPYSEGTAVDVVADPYQFPPRRR
jgi:hypothetical protein